MQPMQLWFIIIIWTNHTLIPSLRPLKNREKMSNRGVPVHPNHSKNSEEFRVMIE